MIQFSTEWLNMVNKVDELICKANLTTEQIDRIYAIGDYFFDDRKKYNNRLSYWAKVIGLPQEEKEWIFEWIES